jgi:hypothetical protein
MKKALLAAAALTCMGSAALAGPNSNGTLVAALSVGTVYTTDNSGYCGTTTVDDCDNAVVTTSGGTTVVINVLAAIAGSPRLAGVTWGIVYSPGVILSEYGNCGDFELPDGAWPDSGTGNAVTWSTAQTTNIIEIYWFAAYNYYTPDCHVLQLGPHPTQLGQFGDDSVPSQIDPIAGYSSFGFDCPGVLVCPAGERPGACCTDPDGDGYEDFCTITLASGCAGTFQGPDTVCQPNPCPQPPVTEACCFNDGSCQDLTVDECIAGGGTPQGPGSACATTECPPVPTINSSWGEIKNNYR